MNYFQSGLLARAAEYSIWERLQNSRRPIILYGTGNGGDKILAACDKYGIKVSAVFASDGFVRNRTFHNMPVVGYDDILSEYGDDITILAAFGTNREEVISFFYKLDLRHNFIIPDVPLYGGDIFDRKYFLDHGEEFEKLYYRLADDMSRNILADLLNFRLTGKLSYLLRTNDVKDALLELVAPRRPEIAIDGGAFKGDSASDMLASLPTLKRVYACEADPKTFKRLCEYCAGTGGAAVPINCALSDRVGDVEYVSSSSRGAGVEGRNRRSKTVFVEQSTVDRIIGDGRLDYLKLDVEGDESKALCGAEETIRRERPVLSVSLYHRTDDAISLVKQAEKLLGDCLLYLRRPFCIPMWDLTLYAVPQ